MKMTCCAIAFIMVGCSLYKSNVKCSKLTNDFFHITSIDERMRQFPNHTINEQYELYIFGNQVVHPPAIYLAPLFAEQGPIIIPLLRSKLEAAPEELTIRDIVSVLRWMAKLKLYDFSKDLELISLLDKRVRDMNGIWKPITYKMFSEIHSMQ